MWSVAGKDWKTQNPSSIEQNVTRRVRGGEIILLHDGSPTSKADRSGTVQATERLVIRLQAEGFQFVTVPEMAAGR